MNEGQNKLLPVAVFSGYARLGVKEEETVLRW